MDETWILLDPNTGLHVPWYFWLRVLDEVNRSARYGSPFALLMLEPRAQKHAPKDLLEAAARVPAAVRSTDLAGLVGSTQVGVMLPHQDVHAAEAAMECILQRLGKTTPRGVRWEARLLCYPQDGAEISNLLTSGNHQRPSSTSEVERLA